MFYLITEQAYVAESVRACMCVCVCASVFLEKCHRQKVAKERESG